MTQRVLEYVIIVYGMFLQMTVAYNIHKNKPKKVTAEFVKFNNDFARMVEMFKEITGEDFKAGKNIALVPKVAEVKPVKRADTADPEISDKQRQELLEFLRRNSLEELAEKMFRAGATLEDVLDMDEEDMREVGIHAFKVRATDTRVAAHHDRSRATRKQEPAHAWLAEAACEQCRATTNA